MTPVPAISPTPSAAPIRDRSSLPGSAVAALFGVAWVQWGAAGVSGAASVALRVAGVLIGLGILIESVRLWRLAPDASRPAPSAPQRRGSRSTLSAAASYVVVAALEIAACGGGTSLLTATGHPEYVIAWIATVVGLHFVAFGRLFFTGFYWLGAALIVAGVAGATVGIVGGGSGGIKVTSGLIAGLSLFVSGWTVVSASRASEGVSS